MKQTIVIDDGTSFKQQEFEVSGVAKQLARAIQSFSYSTDPDEIETRLLMAVQDLLKPCSATLTAFQDEKAIMRRTIDVDGKIFSHSDLLKLEQVNFGKVPKNSVTTRIANIGRPILWIASDENEKNEWLRTPMLVGVPWFNEKKQIAGALVASLFRNERPSDDHIFFLQAIADAFSDSYILAAKYQASIKNAQIVERATLNQLIHDSVAQDIFSMQLKIRDILKTGGTAHTVSKDLIFLQDQLDSARTSLRQIIFSEDCSKNIIFSAGELIKEEIRRHENLGGVAVVYREDHLSEISEKCLSVVCSLLREGLLNIRKHADATIVSVRVVTKEDKLVVIIMDDGKGLVNVCSEERTTGLHFGIKNLCRLVESLEGTFLLSNVEEGSGTLLKAIIPLRGEML